MKRLVKANFDKETIYNIIRKCLNDKFDLLSLQVNISDNGKLSWKAELYAKMADYMDNGVIFIGGYDKNGKYISDLYSIEAVMFIDITDSGYKVKISQDFYYPIDEIDGDYDFIEVETKQDIINYIEKGYLEDFDIDKQELKKFSNNISSYFQPAAEKYCGEWYEEIITKINQRLKDV